MQKIRDCALCLIMLFGSTDAVYADTVKNMSFEGKYKTIAHFCRAGKCDEQSEAVTSAFFIGVRNAHVYSGANKGLVLPFGRRDTSSDGKSVWIALTSVGFNEIYARDGFTIMHSYTANPDGTCSIAVSVIKAPPSISTSYRTEMESCKVAEGDIFASR